MNYLKLSLLFIFFVFSSFNSFSQTFNEPVGQCFGKSNRKSIEKRIEQLKIRASKEMNCPVDSISYVIDKKYTFSYTKECRHLPKIMTFYACGQSKTYEHLGLTGLAGYWLLASWTEKK
ncbi:hypothetical protein AT05_01485 [Schleiferia thermophila str. Yellowstone]|uniref:hypothetical protein n=1 Tax=Schleiferia thermophila TaxID=884107 RepID=UPI0004E6421C|nr:hypothetical protein [Schleiferia thermophila]KFD40307.1 hypothetical protein AT05_01485 [Schleiferia thermophila str. Yellowstone]